MKTFKLLFLLVVTVTLNACSANGQEKSVEKSLKSQLKTMDLSNSSALTALLKDYVQHHAQVMSDALCAYDFKTLYAYMPEEDINGQTLKEFVESSQGFREVNESIITEAMITVENPHKIAHCESLYYSIMNQELSQKISGKPFSRKSQLLGVSKDGIHWKFYNIGGMSIEALLRDHLGICEEILLGVNDIELR